MALGLVGSNTATGSGTVSVTFPGGVAQNDVAYGAGMCQQTSDSAWTAPDGTWTFLADLYSNNTADTNLAVARKVQGVTPDSSVVFDGSAGSSRHVGLVFVFSGADTTTPEDAATTTNTTTGNNAPDGPAITTATDSAIVLSIIGSSQPDVVTAPAGYGNLARIANGADTGIAGSFKTVSPAGAEDPGAYGGWTGGSGDSEAMATIAVKPASAGATYTLTAAQGSFALTGQAVSFALAHKLALAQGSFALSGQAVSFVHGYTLPLGQGSFALNGQSIAFQLAHKLAIGQGSFALNGQAVTLTYTPAGTTYTLVAAQGSFSLTGNAVAFGYTPTVLPAAYPAYPKRRRIQVQRLDGTVTEVDNQTEAWALLRSLASERRQQVTTRKTAKARKVAIAAAEAITYGPPTDLFAKIETPKAPISEATFARMMRSVAVAAEAERDEEDVEMLLLAS